MGFWASLKSNASDALNFLNKYSGNIVTVASTVAEVAKLLATEEKEDAIDLSDAPLLPTLNSNLEKAAQYLADYAKSLLLETSSTGPDVLTSVQNLPALWKSPSSGGGRMQTDVVQDIHKFLALNDLPHTYNESGKPEDLVDLGEWLSARIFANGTPQGASPVLSTTFQFESAGLNIDGAHAWYPIQLGNDKSAATWHAHVRMKTSMTKEFRAKWKSEQKKLALPHLATSTEGSFNTTTISIVWTGVRGLEQLMPVVVKNMPYEVCGDPMISGTSYTYKFKSATNVPPAKVLRDLTTAVDTALGTPTDEVPRFPNLFITNTTTYFAP